MKKIFITGSSGFIGFHLSKLLLDKGCSVHGYDSMNDYYDIKLKKSRLLILKKYKNFSFTKGLLENEKVLSNSISKFKPSIITFSLFLIMLTILPSEPLLEPAITLT